MIAINKTKHPAPSMTGRGLEPLYPFAQMEVGDSFDAPNDMGASKGGSSKRQSTIISSSYQYAKNHASEAKFTTRKIDENTIRCWRVA